MMSYSRFSSKPHVLLIALFIILFSCTNSQKSKEEGLESTSDEQTKRVFFKFPRDGATVASPVYIDMGLEGMMIEPAGPVREGYGHHHILINQTHWPKGSVIPTSDSTLHYGKGQTEVSIDLEPGDYVISLQFADGVHSSFGKEMSSSINITVE